MGRRLQANGEASQAFQKPCATAPSSHPAHLGVEAAHQGSRRALEEKSRGAGAQTEEQRSPAGPLRNGLRALNALWLCQRPVVITPVLGSNTPGHPALPNGGGAGGKHGVEQCPGLLSGERPGSIKCKGLIARVRSCCAACASCRAAIAA